MTAVEKRQLDELLVIAEEDGTMTEWEQEFVRSLDAHRRDSDLSWKQADVFDRLIRKHLRGEIR